MVAEARRSFFFARLLVLANKLVPSAAHVPPLFSIGRVTAAVGGRAPAVEECARAVLPRCFSPRAQLSTMLFLLAVLVASAIAQLPDWYGVLRLRALASASHTKKSSKPFAILDPAGPTYLYDLSKATATAASASQLSLFCCRAHSLCSWSHCGC